MTGLLDVDDALAAIRAEVTPLPSEAVALIDAAGRILAGDVVADVDVPGFDNSAMDGYAVRSEDVAGASADVPVRLRVAGESRAGAPAGAAVGRGEAIAISTGAMMPAGADAVVRVEDTSRVGGQVDIAVAPRPGRDVRRAGEDVRAGAVVLARGRRLGPAELGGAAAVGAAQVECAVRPHVALLTTGDELRAPGQPLPAGAIYDTSAFAVAAQLRGAGADVTSAGQIADERGAIVAHLEAIGDVDVVVTCAGVSVGEHDHVRAALGDVGVRERFWGVALRPGGPTWFGVGEREGRRTLVFGLPGNPVSAMVTCRLFVLPALAALQGSEAVASRVSAILDEPYAKAPGRMHAVRCRAELRDDGWHVRPSATQGSHVLSALLDANALVLLERGRGDVAAGERVTVELLTDGL